ncbi:MAG: hypothetical protein ACFFB2_19350 [Promethearchaeota archaeon]
MKKKQLKQVQNMSEFNKPYYSSSNLNNLNSEYIIHIFKPRIFKILGFGFLGLLFLFISLLLVLIGFNIVLDPDINANIINMSLTIGLGFILIVISVKFLTEPLTSRILITEDEIRIKRYFRTTTVLLKSVSTVTTVYSIPFFRNHKDARLKRILLHSKALNTVSITMDVYSVSQRHKIKDILLHMIRKVSKITINEEYVKEFPPINF